MSRKWGGFFHNDADHRDFTAIGTAAGNKFGLLYVAVLMLLPGLSHRSHSVASC
jgi:hypothetical protein